LGSIDNHSVSNFHIVQRFFDEWGIDIVLHSGRSFYSWLVCETAWSKQLYVGAGTVSAEPWRGTVQSRQYHVLQISPKRRIAVESRIFLVDNSSWISSPEHSAQVRLANPMNRPRLAGSILRQPLLARIPEEPNLIVELIAQMPQLALEQTVYNLGPAMKPYNPEEETRAEFAKRLVEYFEARNSLSILRDAATRSLGTAEFAKASVFVCYSQTDREIAERVAQIIRALGHDMWFDAWKLKYSESISSQIVEGMRTADVCILIISSASMSSSNVNMELGMWIAMHGNSTIISIVIGECAVPTVLEGVQKLEIRNPLDYDLLSNKLPIALQRAVIESSDMSA